MKKIGKLELSNDKSLSKDQLIKFRGGSIHDNCEDCYEYCVASCNDEPYCVRDCMENLCWETAGGPCPPGS